MKMNETFSSLSSDNPSATTLAVPNFAMFMDTTTSLPYHSITSSSSPSTILPALLFSTPTSVRETRSAPATTDISTPSPTADISMIASDGPYPGNNFSAGIIGGAVVGAIAGVALLGGLALFLSKRRNASGSTTRPSELDSRDEQNPYITNQICHTTVHEKYASGVAVQAYTEYPPQEMSAGHRPAEMDGTGSQQEKTPSPFL